MTISVFKDTWNGTHWEYLTFMPTTFIVFTAIMFKPEFIRWRTKGRVFPNSAFDEIKEDESDAEEP